MNADKFFNEVLPQIGGASIQMIAPGAARCVCPCAELHTTPTSSSHTTAYWNSGQPQIYCRHRSCRNVLAALNADLRRLWCLKGRRVAPVPVAKQLDVEVCDEN